MREILFRAKHYRTKQWVYGIPFKNPLRGSEDAYYPQIIPEVHGVHSTIDSCSIVEETIGQYTGLTDANGNKIFDGDVLRFGDKNYLVFWNGECFQWQMRTRKDRFLFPVYDGQDTGRPVECITLGWVAAEIPIIGTMSTEIVGNIYDNPELIEE